MPQLMPMYWILSFLLVFVFIFAMMKFYFDINNLLMNKLMVGSYNSSWKW